MSWKVEQVMTPREDVVVAYRDTPFKQIVELMNTRDVTALPVVDAQDRVLGVVSEADLLLKEELHAPRVGEADDGARTHARAHDRRRAQAFLAGELMTSPAVTVTGGETIAAAARLMHENRVKRLPVVDELERLIGIVSRRDLLTVFLRADYDIEAEVARDLRRHLWLTPQQVQAAVRDGAVTLRGEVETRSLAGLAHRLAAGVDGVTGVIDELTFKLDDQHLEAEPPPLALQLSASERRGL
ncbi:MAG TPA: CBS domain-containing protein [Candidatus Dormibacteraeota bacterium]